MAGRSLPLDVYVVTSAGLVPGRTHLDVALAALEGGATAVQLRAPDLEDEALVDLAADLSSRFRERGVLFVVNDRIDVAIKSGAGGAHVGQDESVEAARDRLGSLVLGVSVGSAGEARSAQEAGADYLGVTVWETATKPEARPVGLDGLRFIVESTSLPVVGIGGVTASNAGEVLAAGAAGVAVVSAVGAAPDPVEATRALAEAVRASRSRETR